MNTCTFEGRLPRDAVLKPVGENMVSNFSIASDVGFGDRKTTLWIECSIWGKRGEALNKSLLKGQQVILVGELSTREYDKDGQTKTSLSLNVQSLAFGSAPKDAEGQTMTSSTTIADNNTLDDEIPF
jgi:single-strand DNA-binding protein